MAETTSGHIAARIDRLPLTRVQWHLAILIEITWGFIIVDTDGIGARLYPFVWRPNHIMSVSQYAVIQALQVGLGVLWCVPKDAITSWVKVPPGQWSVGPVAGRRFNWVTGWIDALRPPSPWAGERIDGP